MAHENAVSGPDFALGVPLAEIPENGTLPGRVGDEPVLLSRLDGELFAVGGACTHYGGQLAPSPDDGGSVRCPLHHACFDLRTGAALRAPALDPLDRWQVEVEGDRAFVRRKLDAAGPIDAQIPNQPETVVIVGGGAAALACAAELRRLGYGGSVTMLSADADPPCDRPNLSKDFLAGTAPEEWIPLRPEDWYAEQRIELHLGANVTAIDLQARTVSTASGECFKFDRLLLATGSEANRLNAPGFGLHNVRTLRTLADARAIIGLAQPGTTAAIVGSSFIGLEAAAALRNRGVEVAIVSPEAVPFEHVFGAQLGRFLQDLHEANGVRFHLGRAAASFDGRLLKLADGQSIEADFVLVGIGARPRVDLAEAAGLVVMDGVRVDERLETSAPGVFAAGDIAAYPDPLTGEPVRIEHWVVAERHGQSAAANMLGLDRRFDDVPFFWTEQYGVAVRYVGHARGWDEVVIEGDMASRTFVARYLENGVHLATATVGCDGASLADERLLEQRIGRQAGAARCAREPRAPASIQSPV